MSEPLPPRLDDGKPRGVITRQDVLGFLAAR